MKKFSAGGAQGRYDRRMADIEKDFKKAMARKTGKDAEVAEAKRQQRIADAKDDLAKRTGADRSATRAAERLAESNLTKTRKYGAAKSVTKDTAGPTGKVTDTLGAITPLKSGLATPAKKAEVKKAADKPKPSAADTARNKFFQDSLRKGDIKKTQLGLSNAPSDQGFSRKSKVLGTSTKTDTKTPTKTTSTTSTGTGTSRLARAADPKDKSNSAQLARLGAAVSYLNPFSYVKGVKREDPSEVNKAKGGKVKKEKTMKYAKGGKAAPKFGAAMKKKSADTKGRAMVKKAGGGKCYASGGLVAGHKSADGIAKKGKTKGTMATMARGGAAKMRGRDSYGGAMFKKGGSC
jgi:hypothetical protein